MTSVFILRPSLLIACTGAQPIENGLISLRNDRIEYVGPRDGYKIPPGAEVRDLPGKTVMPGLINAHLHFFFSGMCSAEAPMTLRQFILNVKVTLREGVTTAADLGAPWEAISGLKRWAAARPDRAPRILAAGPFLTAPGGYPFDYVPPEMADLGGAIGLEGPDHARRVVEDLAGKGVDLVKIGIVGRSFNDKPLPVLSDETVRAVCDAAHARGLRVVVHAVYADDWARAARLSVDAIVHNSLEPLPEEAVRAVVERGLPVVPTLLVWSAPLERPAEPGFLDQPWVRERLEPAMIPDLAEHRRKLEASGEFVPWIVEGVKRQSVEQGNRHSFENLARLHRAGAVLGVGTDAAVCYNLHGSPAWEMERMARAGLEPMDLLVAATRGSARVLGIESEVGTLEAGKRADLLVLDANPLEEIHNLRKVHGIVKGGCWLEPPALKASPAERLALLWRLRRILPKALLRRRA